MTDECFGQAPTIVGGSSIELEGTDGPDVVLTNGAGLVRTYGGDDLVCITGSYAPTSNDDEGRVFLTGTGNDRIDSSLAHVSDPYLPLIIDPGPDADEVIGGPAREDVRAQERGAKSSRRDVINTAGGRDDVYTRGDDVVLLGPGQDKLLLYDDVRGGFYDGGEAGDTLVANLTQGEKASWTIDNRSGMIVGRAGHEATLSGFSIFEVGVRGDLTFLGSDARETFATTVFNPHGFWIPRGAVRIQMGGGDDSIKFYGGAQNGDFPLHPRLRLRRQQHPSNPLQSREWAT
jgi:hypothetical protein